MIMRNLQGLAECAGDSVAEGRQQGWPVSVFDSKQQEMAELEEQGKKG